VGGVPCLLDDAHGEVERWRSRLGEFVRENNASRDAMLAQLVAEPQISRLSRHRVETLRAKLEIHRDRILAVAEHAGLAPGPAVEDPTSTVQGEGELTSYFHQLHRDWGWDTGGAIPEEVGLAVAEVMDALDGGAPLGDMLVLGAGACRLPWEIHARGHATSTLALDINPLPFWVARRLLSGEVIRLFEFPLRPRSTEDVAVDRGLQTEARGGAEFAFAFADGLDPPVRSHAFDTLFTPWFIDQIPRDIQGMFAIADEVLKPGGVWLNHGPLVYHPTHTALMHRYCVDEVLGMVEANGFRIDWHRFARLPYMVSPAGTQGRTEMVLTFRATKVGGAKAPAEVPAQAAWLSDPTVPIPVLPGLAEYQPPHPMFVAIVGAIDGRRTAADIGRLLAERHGVPPASATAGVLAALQEIARALEPAP